MYVPFKTFIIMKNEKLENVIVIDYLSLYNEPNYSLDATKIDNMVKWFKELREKYKHL